MRRLLVALCGLLLRIFFRRIEVVGRHHLPPTGSVVFVLNHPSGLVDPLFILCLSGRRVSFLAKEPLFHMPVIGAFVRAFECLPVYRTRDGADPQKNLEMMKNAVALLSSGNALALFPEGTSHSEPELKPFKTGAARIALSAASHCPTPVWLVPAALYYEQKDTFRSRAVLAFGEALQTPQLTLEGTGQPPLAETHALTQKLQLALLRIMPTAESANDLVIAELAERVLVAAARDEGRTNMRVSLAVRMNTRRRLIDSYRELIVTHPTQVGQLVRRIQLLHARMEQLGLPIDAPLHRDAGSLHREKLLLLRTLALAPLGTLGALLHYPTYRLIRFLAFRYAGAETDVLATGKLLGGLLLYPVTWLLAAGVVWFESGHLAWLLCFFLGPFLAFWSLRFTEVLGALGRLRRQRTALSTELGGEDLKHERSAVAREILDLQQIA